MGLRPVQRIGDATKGENPVNIHLWIIKDCDCDGCSSRLCDEENGCDYRQRFAAGAGGGQAATTRHLMEAEWYCRSCRSAREREKRKAQKTLPVQGGGR